MPDTSPDRIIARQAATGLSRRRALHALAAMGMSVPAAAHSNVTLRREAAPGPAATALDPNLTQPVVPWERTLSAPELRVLSALCDLILPADERSPAASALGCHDFIDEWVSAPYPEQLDDQAMLMDGLMWLRATCEGRFGQPAFDALSVTQQSAICEEIAQVNESAELQTGVRFFARVRDLTATAFWTTPQGMHDLQYVGNVPLAKWNPPPAAVLEHLGLDERTPGSGL
jgi:hypothetical protein